MTHRYPNEGTQVREKLTYPYMSKVVYRKGTQGTETSQYLQEEKEKIDSVSSGERKRKSPNLSCLQFRGQDYKIY